MSVVILGQVRCAICGRVLLTAEETWMIPNVFTEGTDRLHRFSGMVAHRACVEKENDSQALLAALAEHRAARSARPCLVCNEVVHRGPTRLATSRLGPTGTEAGRYNYLVLHKTCLHRWTGRDEFVRFLERQLVRPDAFVRPLIYALNAFRPEAT